MQYTYTTSGNLSYQEKGDTTRTYTYEYATDDKLTQAALPDKSTLTYSYDSLRRSNKTVYMPKSGATDTKKLYTTPQYRASQFTVDGKTTTYRYNNGMLLSEQTGDETLCYYYDAAGKVTSLTYKKGSNAEVSYFYARNLQGDIIAIYRNSDSALIGTYEYDLWGRPVSMTESTKGIDTGGILTKNPFRYRGYYYDTETGFYYLSSRYYDPEIRRFISPDTIDVLTTVPMALTDKNLYAYCDNNPIMREDTNGQFWNIIAGAVIGGGLELAGQLLSGNSLSEVNWAKVRVCALPGGLTAAVGPVAGCLISGATNVAMDALDGNINNIGDVAGSFA